MPIFGGPSAVEADIEKATSEYSTGEDWQMIMDICDKIQNTPSGSRDYMRAILKRVNNKTPHVALQALTLLESCVKNCGKPFHLDVCSREFVEEARGIIQRCHPKVAERFKGLIRDWSKDFSSDPQLDLIPTFYAQLKREGESFPKSSSSTTSSSSLPTKTTVSSSPRQHKSSKVKEDVAMKEDEDLARAIQLSLAESSGKASTPSSSLYPSMTSALPSAMAKKEGRKVKALYDFEAVEDNELSFQTGDIIKVIDDSDVNWWKGENHNGVGLFPANFVTSDLSAEPEPAVRTEKKKVRFTDKASTPAPQVAEPQAPPAPVEINEEKMDLCLSMLKNASVEDLDPQEQTIEQCEASCQQMAPLITEKMEEIDRKHKDLESLNEQFMQAVSLYQQWIKEPMPAPVAPTLPAAMYGYGMPPQAGLPTSAMYQPTVHSVPQHLQAPQMYASLPRYQVSPPSSLQYQHNSQPSSLQYQYTESHTPMGYSSHGPPTNYPNQPYQPPAQPMSYQDAQAPMSYPDNQPQSLQYASNPVPSAQPQYPSQPTYAQPQNIAYSQPQPLL